MPYVEETVSTDVLEYFTSSVSQLEKEGATKQTVMMVHAELSNCLRTIERELYNEERNKTQYQNDINQVSAAICELNDRVEKAKLRESVLEEKVTRWIDYLREEKSKMLVRDGRLCGKEAANARLSEDIEYLIEMLMEKRRRVDSVLKATQLRRSKHKDQMRHLKKELLGLQDEMKEWDRKVDEISESTRGMEESIKKIMEKLEKQQKVEMDARLTCVHLEKAVAELGRNKPGMHTMHPADLSCVESHSQFHITVSSMTDTAQGTTTLADNLANQLIRLAFQDEKISKK